MQERNFQSSDTTVAAVIVILSTLVVFGWLWDISWQATIGHTGFWAPPHLALFTIGVGFGVLCFWTLQHRAADLYSARSDRPLWKRASLAFSGSILGICGALVMLAAALYDYWWHATQLPEPQVLTPPHAVVAGGVLAIQTSAVLMALDLQTRGQGEPSNWGRFGYVAAAGLLLVLVSTLATEYVGRPNLWHGSDFYKVSGVIFPVLLVAVGRSARLKWGATAAAGVYLASTAIMVWVLQAFPAQTAVTPAPNPLTHMLPPPFPLLLILPALAIDLLIRVSARIGGRLIDWPLAVSIGVTFVIILWATHWYFADLLLSPIGRSYFFAADQWPYHTQLGPWRYQQWALDSGTTTFLKRIVVAMLLAAASARVGLWAGRLAEEEDRAPNNGAMAKAKTAVS